MGKRSTMRKFRKRRQQAGFVLFASLAVLVVGAIVLSGLGASSLRATAQSDGDEAPVQRVQAPSVDAAPEAVAQVETAPQEGAGDGEGAAREQAVAEDERSQRDHAAAGDEGARDDSGDGTGGDGEGRAVQEQKEPEQAAGPPPTPKPATNDLWMDIPALGLNDNYIASSNSPLELDAGATKTVESAFPWQDGANTYISAHRLGYPGTASNYQFYNLPNLALGDRIYLYDENLTVYTYEVSGFLEVDPSETWVTGPQAGRDMISLMTCIENYGDYWTMGPNWNVRYVVQADRVSVDPA